MTHYTITEDQLKELLRYSHSYGRSHQFNYGLFGPYCKQSEPFTEEQAIEYCLSLANNMQPIEGKF